MFECVVNISAGRRDEVESLAECAGTSLRDVHRDEDHNRSVFTLIAARDPLVGDVRRLVDRAMESLDLRAHAGVHPRLGVVDVVPFVALDDKERAEAIELRDETAQWIASTYEVPVFLYGPLKDGSVRTLPQIRQNAFSRLSPDAGPATADPRRGASAVGARDVLVAWNLWVRGISLAEGQRIARRLRRREVRALAFAIGEFVQVSCNLIEPLVIGPAQVYDEVAALTPRGAVDHAELVGLLPADVLAAQARGRWEQLDLSEGRTIESRLTA